MGYAMMKENDVLQKVNVERRNEIMRGRQKRESRRRYFLMQRAAGVIVMMFTAFAVKLLEGDATIALATIPLGLLILTSKEPVIMVGYFWEVED